MSKLREKGLIAKKVGMTRVVDSHGDMVPVTLLKVEKQKITKVLSSEKDGYNGFQVGYMIKSEKNLTKADVSRLRKTGVEENFSNFVEFRTPAEVKDLKVGEAVTADLFKDVQAVDITGLTKGRGFQGAVKRWGASIGRMTHGSRFHRRPGSLGQCTTPGRVFKGKHQPGQMGGKAQTVQNLSIIKVDTETGVIAIKGSVPGNRKSLVQIRETNKKA